MLTQRDLGWIAGIVEGEGCLGLHGNGAGTWRPHLTIGMTDRDTVERLRDLIAPGRAIETQRRPEPIKPLYRVRVLGRRAAAWMMTLYPLLGERRQVRARVVLDHWRTHGRGAHARG